jgi:hypothetical protein
MSVTLSLLKFKGRTRAEYDSWAKEEGINRWLDKTDEQLLICDPHQKFFGLSNNEGWDRWDV